MLINKLARVLPAGRRVRMALSASVFLLLAAVLAFLFYSLLNFLFPVKNGVQPASEKGLMNSVFKIKAYCTRVSPTNKHVPGYYFFFTATEGEDPYFKRSGYFTAEEKEGPLSSLLASVLKIKKDEYGNPDIHQASDSSLAPDSSVVVELGLSQGYGPGFYHLVSFSYKDSSYQRFHLEGYFAYVVKEEETNSSPQYKFNFHVKQVRFGEFNGPEFEFTLGGIEGERLARKSGKAPFAGKTGNDYFRPATLLKLYAEVITTGENKKVNAWVL